MELALAATVLDSVEHGLCIAALTARHARNGHARNEERNFVLVSNSIGRNLLKFFRMGCTNNGTKVALVSIPFHNLVCYGIERFGNVARIVTASNRQILEVVSALVACAEEHVGTVFAIFANERTDGIGTHPRRDGHGVCTVNIVSGVGVGGTGLANVTALCIQDNRDASTSVIGNELLQNEHRLHAHAFVISAVRLYDSRLHITLEAAFQDVGIEALDAVFGSAFERDELEHRVHAHAHRVTALCNTLFKAIVKARHYFNSS